MNIKKEESQMKTIPKDLIAYKKTDIFTEQTVPKGLLNDHKTKEGVWGKINILSGTLEYTIHSSPAQIVELSADHPGVVEPEVLHHVKPIDSVRFYVEFYK
jgi:tellurite resistance-related uncharacterized protein